MTDGLDRAFREPFRAVILDLMMPGIDGCEVLRRLRVRSNLPVLMLTGRGEESDRIVGLELGADDYLPKTFSTRELLARIRAVLRRTTSASAELAPEDSTVVVVGDLRLDVAARLATLGGQPTVLTRVEFDLLAALARGCGRVQTREQLLDAVGSGRGSDVFDRSIDVHIASVRRKPGDDPRAHRFIETVRGVGYVMRSPDQVS